MKTIDITEPLIVLILLSVLFIMCFAHQTKSDQEHKLILAVIQDSSIIQNGTFLKSFDNRKFDPISQPFIYCAPNIKAIELQISCKLDNESQEDPNQVFRVGYSESILLNEKAKEGFRIFCCTQYTDSH